MYRVPGRKSLRPPPWRACNGSEIRAWKDRCAAQYVNLPRTTYASKPYTLLACGRWWPGRRDGASSLFIAVTGALLFSGVSTVSDVVESELWLASFPLRLGRTENCGSDIAGHGMLCGQCTVLPLDLIQSLRYEVSCNGLPMSPSRRRLRHEPHSVPGHGSSSGRTSVN